MWATAIINLTGARYGPRSREPGQGAPTWHRQAGHSAPSSLARAPAAENKPPHISNNYCTTYTSGQEHSDLAWPGAGSHKWGRGVVAHSPHILPIPPTHHPRIIMAHTITGRN